MSAGNESEGRVECPTSQVDSNCPSGPPGSRGDADEVDENGAIAVRENAAIAVDENAAIAVDDAREKLVNLLVSREQAEAVKQHAFWSTQPVPQFGSDSDAELAALDRPGAPIETKTVDAVRKSPLALIDAFEWSDVDITNDGQLEEAYQLLNLHYVEDEDQMFRFDYSRDFLRWALMPPGWLPSWHVGVRVKSTKKLVAFITAVPAVVDVYDQDVKMVEINFLCVHKKLRSKRLAPVLIQEITRRVNVCDIWQAVYTAGAVLPSPVSSSRYYHRSLNPKKLIEVGFSRIAPRMTMARTIKLNSLKSEPSLSGIRLMEERDVPAAWNLMCDHNKRFQLRISYSQDDFAHWFLPRPGVIYTYIVEDTEGVITDMTSFYSLPSSIIRHPKHRTLNAAYSFCNVAVKATPDVLMQDALILANQLGFDVFNALDLGRNDEFLKKCKFHIGDGELQYYIYNWKCRPIEQRKNGLVLL